MRLTALAAAIVFALGGAAAWSAPLETYGQLPSLEHLALSPDGKLLAFETAIKDGRAIVIKTADTGQIAAAFRTGDQKLRSLAWADNDHLLITVSQTIKAHGLVGPKQEYFLTQSYAVSTRQSLGLLNHIEGAMNVVIDLPQPRAVGGRPVVFVTGVAFQEDHGRPGLYSIDLTTGGTTFLEMGTMFVTGWTIDEKGHVIARTEYDEDRKRWSLELWDGLGWKEAFGTDASIEMPTLEGIGPDGASLIFSVPQDGTYVQRQFSLTDGKAQTPPDFGGAPIADVYDPVTNRLIGVEQLGDAYGYHFFDSADQAAWHSIAGTFPGENVQLVSFSADRKRAVVRIDGGRDGAAYQLVDLGSLHTTPLGAVYNGIEPADVAEVRLVTYMAADGTKIPAYLTLPKGKPATNLPLIVLAHGGPAARDTPEFDWWSQALASRGYAVLQPQFRGSNGYGWAHLSAGFGQWGRKMQSDLSDGVRYLAAQGIVDAKRVCIAGASYGGYAALAGATLDHGVYRCAVSVAGVSDPRGFLRWHDTQSRNSDSATMRYWTRFMGVENSDDPKLAEISPIAHADGADIPILLIHGKDDTVVPFDQSADMEAALRHAGKPVTFVKLDGEDHWLSRSETRLQMLQATVSFLEANNPPN